MTEEMYILFAFYANSASSAIFSLKKGKRKIDIHRGDSLSLG
jgi:hypothetical protein